MKLIFFLLFTSDVHMDAVALRETVTSYLMLALISIRGVAP